MSKKMTISSSQRKIALKS